MSGWWESLAHVYDHYTSCWDWSEIQVKYDPASGKFFWDTQSGCSCYDWEDPESLDEVHYGTREQAAKAAREFASSDYAGEPTPDDAAVAYREVRTWRP